MKNMKGLVKVYLAVFWLCQAIHSAPRQPRLSLAAVNMPSYFMRNIDGNPGTYSFGYEVIDPDTGNSQFRNEERYANGTVAGSYGYVDSSGIAQSFQYVADENGYRVFKNVPNKVYTIDPSTEPIRKPEDLSMESSITWTRPKKPNKKKPGNKLVNKIEVDVNNVNREINFIKPPSYYVEY